MKDNYIKTIKWIVIIAVPLLLIAGLCLPSMIIGGIIPFEPTYSQMEKIYSKNYADLSRCIDRLENMDYEYIAIRKTDGSGVMSVKNADGTYDDATIEDASLKESLEGLFENGFKAVFKYDNHVEFVRWSSLDSRKGIAYSFNEDKPDVEWVIDMRPIPGAEYYSYESCYGLYEEKEYDTVSDDEETEEVIEKVGTPIPVDSVEGMTQDEAIELCIEVLGRTDHSLGYDYGFFPNGVTELDGKQYYVITRSRLIDTHYSRMGEAMVAADGSVIYDGYIDADGEYVFCDIIWEKQ